MTTETLNTSSDIINATQNVVIEAVENVAEMIENPNPIPAPAHEVFYKGAEFWVAVAFVVTVLLLCRPIFKVIKNMISKNIDAIQNRIDNAAQLQEDAEKLLASYERKFRNAKKEAEAILKKSQNEIDYFRKASLSRMEQEVAQKEKDMAEKLQNAKASALQEISEAAGNLSIKAVRELLQTKLNNKDIDALIDNSIKKLDKVI